MVSYISTVKTEATQMLTRVLKTSIFLSLAFAEVDAFINSHIVSREQLFVQRALASVILTASDVLEALACDIDVACHLSRGCRQELRSFAALSCRGSVRTIGNRVATGKGLENTGDGLIDHGRKFAFLGLVLGVELSKDLLRAVLDSINAGVKAFLEGFYIPAIDLFHVSKNSLGQG